MIRGLDSVYYFVSDMKRAVDFYKNVLGLEIMIQDESWTSIALNGGVRLGLHIAKQNEFTPSSQNRSGATVSLNVDNIDDAYAFFKSKGVKFVGQISKNPWGNHVAFVDPDGNLLELRQRPQHK